MNEYIGIDISKHDEKFSVVKKKVESLLGSQ